LFDYRVIKQRQLMTSLNSLSGLAAACKRGRVTFITMFSVEFENRAQKVQVS
jgi:hypothetical protein